MEDERLHKCANSSGSTTPTHPRTLSVSFLMFHSHFSRNPLSLYVIWSWLLYFSMVLICCLLQYSIYIDLIYIYIHVSLHSTFIYILIPCIQIMLPHFTWKNFLCIYFMFIFFLHFIDQVVLTMDLPHHKNQVSTLAMSHSLLMWPFHGSLFQLLYEIFSNIFCFFLLTNNCN